MSQFDEFSLSFKHRLTSRKPWLNRSRQKTARMTKRSKPLPVKVPKAPKLKRAKVKMRVMAKAKRARSPLVSP